ncbi:5-formyltetrahydrofolate cyclo-ligase [Halotydeus destructor]|nr:5-formyltetrahydrofolate cyclo-ligase [Halotydeus destructor]
MVRPSERYFVRRLTLNVLSSEVYRRSKRISVFVSMNHEVDTQRIIEDIFASGKECFVPKYDPNSRQMDMLKVNSLPELAEFPLTKWNVRQPAENCSNDEALETGGLHVIIVPGLAFTKVGHRIGFGRGYYDQYLSKCLEQCPSPRPVLIGVAFHQQLVDYIPVEGHDVHVDKVVHPDPE